MNKCQYLINNQRDTKHSGNKYYSIKNISLQMAILYEFKKINNPVHQLQWFINKNMFKLIIRLVYNNVLVMEIPYQHHHLISQFSEMAWQASSSF